jgi:hypothetical protein
MARSSSVLKGTAAQNTDGVALTLNIVQKAANLSLGGVMVIKVRIHHMILLKDMAMAMVTDMTTETGLLMGHVDRLVKAIGSVQMETAAPSSKLK